MLLRNHPLMSRYGLPNWPPVWTWVDGLENKFPKGEVGTLKGVGLSGIQPPDRCYLTSSMKDRRIWGVCCSTTTRSVVT
jgi:hypothetical protein